MSQVDRLWLCARARSPGDLSDSTFQQRLQEHVNTLAVYCKQAKVTPSPAKQTLVHEVPTMSPLPQN